MHIVWMLYAHWPIIQGTLRLHFQSIENATEKIDKETSNATGWCVICAQLNRNLCSLAVNVFCYAFSIYRNKGNCDFHSSRLAIVAATILLSACLAFSIRVAVHCNELAPVTSIQRIRKAITRQSCCSAFLPVFRVFWCVRVLSLLWESFPLSAHFMRFQWIHFLHFRNIDQKLSAKLLLCEL